MPDSKRLSGCNPPRNFGVHVTFRPTRTCVSLINHARTRCSGTTSLHYTRVCAAHTLSKHRTVGPPTGANSPDTLYCNGGCHHSFWQGSRPTITHVSPAPSRPLVGGLEVTSRHKDNGLTCGAGKSYCCLVVGGAGSSSLPPTPPF